jgi:arginine/ornithine N-succinyltransferase beta subunit
MEAEIKVFRKVHMKAGLTRFTTYFEGSKAIQSLDQLRLRLKNNEAVLEESETAQARIEIFDNGETLKCEVLRVPVLTRRPKCSLT